MEGPVEVRVAGGSAWAAAQPAQTLCTGDTLAVRSLGRAAVVLPNDVVLRLDQGSVLTLQAFAPEKASELGLVQGALHVLTRFTKRFGVITPYLNAMVDGTEFTVRV
ncbi:MAG: FecR domain-containing protein, partial [Pseudomonadota bacterium]